MARNFFQKLLGIGNDEEDKKKQSSLYGGTASVRQAQQQKQAQAQADIKAGAPKQSFIERNITDRINANSDLDKFKRIQAGGKADFVADAELRGTRGFTNPLQGAGYGFARPGIKFTNTIAGATKDLGEGTGLLTRTALANLTNNQVARQNVEQDMRRFNARDLSYSGTGGILGTGANVQNKDDLNDPQKLAATILETGMQGGQYIGGVNAAFGKAGVLRSGATGLQRAAFNNPLLTDSLTQGGLNTLATGADQLKQGKFDAGQLAASFGTGAAFPVVTRGLSNVTREAIKPDGVLRDTTGSITVPSKARKYLEDTTQDPKLNPRLQRVPDAPLKPGTPLNQLDSAEVVSFVDSQRGTAKNLTKNQKLDLELNARAGAPRYGIDPELPPAKLADAYVKVLEESGYKPSVLKKVNYYAENTAKPPSISVPTSSLKADPLEALRQEARKYKSAANFERKYNPTDGSMIWADKPKGLFERDTSAVRLNIFPKESVKGKGITKEYTLNLLKEADGKGIKTIVPSLGSYTKDGTAFMDKLASDGWVKKVGAGYEISPKIKEWKTTNSLTDLYNQAHAQSAPVRLSGLDGKPIETDGKNVILYHRTSPESAKNIQETGYLDPMKAGTGNDKAITQDGKVSYLTTNPSQDFYGESVVKVKMPIEEFKRQIENNKAIVAKLEEELATGKVPEIYRQDTLRMIENIKANPEILSSKPLSITESAPVKTTDPLQALKQEALKYKSAEEFADSLNAMKYGKVTGVGQLPVSKINKTQIKALTERGLPHTDTNLKVSDFKPGRQVTQPLEVYSKGGSWVVENGNHRLAQALANGDETVPVVFKGGEGKKYSTPITDLYNQATKPPKTKYLAEDTGLKDRQISISNEELAKRYGGDLEPAQFKKSKFEQSVRGAEEISPELKKELKKSTPMYEAVTNKKQLAKSEELVKKDIGQATASVKERLTAKLGTVDNQTVSDTIAVIKRLDNKGTKKAFQESAELTEQLSLHLTKAGQTVQAASLLGKSTPDGILFRARKQLHQAGVEITPEIQAKLKSARDAIESKPMGSPERNYEIAKMLKITADNIPSTAADKLTTLWKAGLLTGIKTQTGNTLSGAASLGLKKVSDVPTAALDQIAALFTGKRSKALTLEGLGSGGKEGLVKGVRYLKTGIDERGMGFTKAKFDTKQVNFGNGPLGRAAQKYTDTVFGLMGAADQPLYFATLRNNLADLAIVEAKNQGLKGSVKDAFIKNFKKNPPEQAFQTATNAAEKATFANDTLLSKAAGGIRNSVKDSQVGSGVVNVLMPFTKVPSAVITRLFDYSPVGPVKLAVQQIQKGNVTQRALVEALGEATTGTGAMFLGYKLKEAGLMTGSYPEDPKEAALWELEGKKPNSIKVGNTWVSVNYTSPLGQVLGTGARAQEAVASGATGTDLISQTAAGAGKTVIDQSFLQGVSGGLDAITDPERSAGKFIRNQVGSVVPTLSGDVAKATDPKERQINSPLEAAQAKIPGLRKNLIPKVDALGNDINRPSGPINTILNPFRPSDIPNATELSSELRRLQDGGYGVLAKDNTKYLQVGTGKDALKVNLSPAELAKKNKEIGQSVQAQWNEIIASPEYKALSDEDKKRALDNAESDIKAVKKLEILKQKSPESIADMKLTKNQQKLAEGGLLTASAYAKPSEGAGSTDTSQYYKANDAEYNDKKSEYERKLKAGEYTKVGKIKAENELKRLQVGKDFSKDVRDLYGLNKTDLSALLESDPDGARYAEQVIAYDKKLYEAGLIKYRKFKNGIAPSTGKGGGRGGSKKSKNWLPTSTTSKFNASASSSASRKLLANTIVKNPRKKK